jgi:hypothetical protein
MIVVESSHWPLVVVGAVPDACAPDRGAIVEEGSLWASGDLRLAVVIAGEHARARAAQEEVFAWLAWHRERLTRSVSRVAWVFEDETMRQSAERWLTLFGHRLFHGEVTAFRSVRSAIAWLSADDLPVDPTVSSRRW